MNPSLTGYEFMRIWIKELTPKEVEWAKEVIGLVCEKCFEDESDKWYIEKYVVNYLPNYRMVCEKCS